MKVFYVIQQTPDYVQGWFFNNKKKAIEKGMEEVADFTFGQDMINQDHFGNDTDYYSGVEDVKEGFLFYLEDGEWQIRSEAEVTAKEQVTELSGAYFPAKLKGGYAECYCSDNVTSTNSKWEFDYGEIYETKTTMKHVKLFEQFIGEAKDLDRDTMIKWIEKTMNVAGTTEDFNGSPGGIWLCGECGDEYKGNVIYSYYSEDYKNRTFGVDNKWEKELNKRGWYSEWYDTGTSMVWPR